MKVVFLTKIAEIVALLTLQLNKHGTDGDVTLHGMISFNGIFPEISELLESIVLDSY